MAIYIKPTWRKFIPNIEIFINVPLVRVQMMIFNSEISMLSTTYLGFGWQIWKWHGKIRVFEMDSRFISSSIKEEDVVKKSCGCFSSKQLRLNHYCGEHWKK